MLPEPSREQLEEAVLATLYRRENRLKKIIDGLTPKLFQIEVNQRVAQALVDTYRLFRYIPQRGVELRLSELNPPEDKEGLRVFARVLETKALPDDLDLLEVLAGREKIPPVEAKPAARLACAPLSEFADGPQDWLWPARLACGELTLIGGEPGSGKSLVACDLAARITAGRAWPDGAPAGEPGSVLLVASCHEVSRLFRPRLQAAGAEPGRVHVLPTGPATAKGGEAPPFKKTLRALEEALAVLDDCRLVVIDPLRLTIGPTGTNIGGDPAAPLEVLAEAAGRHQVTVLGVASAAYEDRRRTLAGGLKLAAGAAAVWQVARHPNLKHLRLFLPVKTTRSSDLEGLALTLVEERGAARIEWQEGSVPADLADGQKHVDAAGWLRQALAAGPLASKEVLQLGGQNGYTPHMLHHAKAAAGVAVTRDGFGPGATWRWTLAVPNRIETAKIA